jgi:DNA-binding transcriptional regulator YhcF (GntR family)
MNKQTPFIYQQVKKALVEMIAKEKLEPGDKLPSERQLAKQLGCNYHTVRKSLALLEDDLLVECRVGSGTFVTGFRKAIKGIDGEQQEVIDSPKKVSSTTKPFVGVICPAAANEFSMNFFLIYISRPNAEGWESKSKQLAILEYPAENPPRNLLSMGVLPCFCRLSLRRYLFRNYGN